VDRLAKGGDGRAKYFKEEKTPHAANPAIKLPG